MNKHLERARQMRSQINNITADFTDEQALDNKELYPDWNGNGVQLAVGAVVYYNDNLYRVIQPHTTQDDWTPDKVPALFTVVGGDWEEWEPGSYAKGTKRKHNGKKWVSNVDGNIWEPGATGVYTWDEWAE